MGKIYRRLVKKFSSLSINSQLFMLIPLVTILIFFNWVLFFIAYYHAQEKNIIASMEDLTERTQYYMDVNFHSITNLFSRLEADSSLYKLKNGVYRNSGEISRFYLELDTILRSALLANQESLGSIYIDFNDGALQAQKFNSDTIRIDFDYKKWKENYPEHKIYFQDVERNSDVKSEDTACIVFRLYEWGVEGEHGVVLFSLRKSYFETILSSPKSYEGSFFSILTEEGKELNLQSEAEENILPLSKTGIKEILQMGDGLYQTLDNGLYVCSRQMEYTPWKLVLKVPRATVMQNIWEASLDMLFRAILSIALIGLFVSVLARHITKPLVSFTKAVSTMKNETLSARFHENGCREIVILSAEMTRLREYSVQLMEEISREKVRVQKAELHALQEQIKPHFLYNILYSIQQLCGLGENKQAEKMCEELARFYRIGISNGSDIIPLCREIEHVQSYLNLQKMRFPNQFDYVTDIDPSIRNLEIPKFILQPLVENAIVHGIQPTHQMGFISITGGLDGREIYIEVHDNGKGVTKEQEERLNRQFNGGIQESVGIGLHNVYTRLRHCFGDGVKVQISSDAYVDTVVRITFMNRMEGK